MTGRERIDSVIVASMYSAPEDWERVGQALDRLRPLATEAIRVSFEQTMGDLIEQRRKRLIDR